MALRPRKRHVQGSWADHHRENMANNQEYPWKDSIPYPLVRSLTRGILMYFSMPIRRRRADDLAGDWLEEGLMELIDRIAAEGTWTSGTGYNNEEVNRASSLITKSLMGLLRHPHPLTLKPESDWLCEQLAPYGRLSGVLARKQWLSKELRSLLRGLNEQSRCGRTTCPRKTDLPDSHELNKWVGPGSTIATVRFHILAHFHGSTFSTVKRMLSSPPF